IRNLYSGLYCLRSLLIVCSPSRALYACGSTLARGLVFGVNYTQTLVDHGSDLIDVLVSGTRLRQCVMTHPIAADRCRAQLEVLASHPAQAQDVPQRKLFEQVAQML